jgi:cytoskeletal protein RodZ
VTDDDRWASGENWHDSQAVVLAAGLAALILLGLLVYGVIRVSRDSVNPPADVFPSTSAATTPSSGRKSPTSTRYTVPSVQTSQANVPPISGSPTESPSDDPGGSGDAEVTRDTPTTTYNPYPTTTPTNAGHI